MKSGFKMQISQKLQISQSQIQSLELLAMDNLQLAKFMQNEYLENPLMEYSEKFEAPQGSEDLGKYYEKPVTYNKSYQNLIEEENSRKRELLADNPNEIYEALLSQLTIYNYTKEDWFLFQYMIDCLDDTGFFTTPLSDIAMQTGMTLSAVESALHTLQQLEPHGIFAKNLKDCLLIQLFHRNMQGSNIWKIVDQFLPEIAAGKISTISRSLSLSTAEVRKCIEEIAKLNPRPMNELGHVQKQYIVPDIIVEKHNKQWNIELNDKWVDNYHINDYYLSLMTDSKNPELITYFQTKLERIRFIQNSIRQRRRTIGKITQCILSRQEPFFCSTGPLRPMTMQSLAEELNVHSSTICRTVNQKYIQYPKGIILMRALFSQSISGGNSEKAVNSSAIKEMISEIIQNENKKKPLSDQKIAALLKEKEIIVSRRSVAQYRDSLGIKSSFERKTASTASAAAS